MVFHKYHGAGNDFVLLDNRSGQYNELSREDMANICHRRFGVGADGLMLLNKAEAQSDYDFVMRYYNSDGREGSLCGNGARCLVAFANHIGVCWDQTNFLAADGPHTATIEGREWIRLKMANVSKIEEVAHKTYVLNTGSPHYIKFVDSFEGLDVVAEGRAIRYSEQYKEEGINVNFVRVMDNSTLQILTYERGVEDETFACGTGVTAAALAASFVLDGDMSKKELNIHAKGGMLKVSFSQQDASFQEVWLSGPALKVFEGRLQL